MPYISPLSLKKEGDGLMSTAEIQSRDGKHLYVIKFEHLRKDKFYVLDLWGDTGEWTYNVHNKTKSIVYYTSYGAWKYIFSSSVWLFKENGESAWKYTVIRESGIPQFEYETPTYKMRGKHYDAMIVDDMVDSFAYAVSPHLDKDIKQAISWYTTIMNKKKGGNEMNKCLYHVILFNRKTETIDFKEYIPAKDASDASMQAAQSYGKYDSNVHVVIVKQIDYSQYAVKE